jgi:hypothetical protein
MTGDQGGSAHLAFSQADGRVPLDLLGLGAGKLEIDGIGSQLRAMNPILTVMEP